MGDQLFLERFIWFDNEARHGRYPNATNLADHFELSTKTAHRSINYFRDCLQAPLEYDESIKGYFYTDLSFQLEVLEPEWLREKVMNEFLGATQIYKFF